jgi:hypothetical protein
MRSPLWLILTVAVCGWQPGRAAPPAASAEVRSEMGLHRATFHVPQGTLNVNFPDDMAVGESVSGSVYQEPKGKTREDQIRSAAELSGYVFDLPGQTRGASGRRFRWRIPERIKDGLVTVLLRDRKNRIVAQCALPVDPAPAPPATGPVDLPAGAQEGATATAWGPFAGESETSVTVGGKPAEVIAESPRKVVFLIPHDVVGASTLEVRNAEVSARGPIHLLGLRVAVAKRNMRSGEVDLLTAVVSGLGNLQEPASLILVNDTPDVIALEGGAFQQIAIQPADVRPGGTFQIERALTGELRGGYRVRVMVTRPSSSWIPFDRVAARSIERWSQSTKIAVAPEAGKLMLSDIDAARPQLDRFLGAQLAFGADASSLLGILVRSYCFDLRDRKLRPAVHARRRTIPYALAFAPDAPARLTLEASDVRRFSFAQFLADLLARLTPSRPLGHLLVRSTPDRQPIFLDESTGEDYFTARLFVVNLGDHAVRVGGCRRHVLVNANQQAVISCPAN